MEQKTIYQNEIQLAAGELLTMGKNKSFDLKIKAYENLIIEIKIKELKIRESK